MRDRRRVAVRRRYIRVRRDRPSAPLRANRWIVASSPASGFAQRGGDGEARFAPPVPCACHPQVSTTAKSAAQRGSRAAVASSSGRPRSRSAMVSPSAVPRAVTLIGDRDSAIASATIVSHPRAAARANGSRRSAAIPARSAASSTNARTSPSNPVSGGTSRTTVKSSPIGRGSASGSQVPGPGMSRLGSAEPPTTMRATIQLCTYNRAALLERVLDACFEQTADPDSYEVVLVNDGSPDDTPAVVERARQRATCRFEVIDQQNSGLAKGRNAGIARATGERIIFIDDDVLPTPNFVEEHLRSHDAAPLAIVRGGASTSSRSTNPAGEVATQGLQRVLLDDQRLCAAADDPRDRRVQRHLAEYGWKTSTSACACAAVKAVFNPKALSTGKPRLLAATSKMIAKRAGTHRRNWRRCPHWRAMATGDNLLQRALHSGCAASTPPKVSHRARRSADRPRARTVNCAPHEVINEAYFEEPKTRARNKPQPPSADPSLPHRRIGDLILRRRRSPPCAPFPAAHITMVTNSYNRIVMDQHRCPSCRHPARREAGRSVPPTAGMTWRYALAARAGSAAGRRDRGRRSGRLHVRPPADARATANSTSTG